MHCNLLLQKTSFAAEITKNSNNYSYTKSPATAEGPGNEVY